MPVYWMCYIIALYIIVSFGHGFVVQMFENIPEVQITAAIIGVVAVFMAFVVVLSQFINNEKDELVKKKEAKLKGETYDEVNGKISQKMFWGYPVLAIIAAGILSTIVLLIINEVAETQYAEWVSTTARASLIGCVAELIAFALVDRFYLRAAMDGLFFERVEKPATEKFLNGDMVAAVEGAVEKVVTAKERYNSLIGAGFTEAEALEMMQKKQ